MELIYDGYNIPDKYITAENRVLHQFPKIYKKLGERGDLKLIKKMLQLDRNSYMHDNADYAMRGAAKAGNIKILKWMVQNDYKRYERVTAYAARGNQLKTLKWLIDRKFPITDLAVYYAAGKGYMDIVKFLAVDKKCEIDCHYAACKGQFEIIKYLHTIDPGSIHGVCDGAARSGHLDMMKFAYENGATIGDDISCTNVHILSWLINNGHIEPSKKISERIAWAGNLECLQLLHRHKFPILSTKVFTKAVSGRNIAMIKWLRGLGCPFDQTATYAAVDSPSAESREGGSLEILKMLIEWDCPLEYDICKTPAYYGDLEMLKYLVSIGCALSASVIEYAASGGHLHIIIWAREQGCEWNAKTCSDTVEHDHLNILKWLRGIDRDTCELKSNETEICPWDDKFGSEAIFYERTDMFKFALNNGYVFSDEAYKEAFDKKAMHDHFCRRNR